MPSEPIRNWIEKFERAQRARKPDDALAALHELQTLEPREPSWPKRIAEIHAAASRREAELEALLRALELQIDAEQTTLAIATAKRILSLDPKHAETENRLHLLYTIPSLSEGGAEAGREAEPVVLRQEPAIASTQAPLEEIVLTEVVVNTRRVTLADPEQTGAAEIPLDANETTQVLELYLDTLAPESESGVAAGDPTLADPKRNDEQALRAKLFASLSQAEIDRLVAESEIIEIPAGREIIRQGDRADRMYVILDGSMAPIAEDLAGEPGGVRMGILEAGDFFGEIGLLTRQPRNASVRALVPSRLLAIDRSTVRDLLRTHRDIFGLVLRTLRYRLVDRLVHTSPIFACFARAARSDVAKQFRLLEVRDGTTIIREGVPDQGIYVVLAGQVEVTQSSQQGDKVLASLGHGEVIGETSVLFGQPAIATVTARGKCWLFALTESRFNKILHHNPRLREILLAIGEDRARENRMQYWSQQQPEHQ